MTYDQFAELARKLAKPNADVNKQVYGAHIDSPLNGLISWSTFYGDDGKAAVGNLDSAHTIKFFDVLTTMARDGVAPPPSIAFATEAPDMLATGNVAMAINDAEACAQAMDNAGLDLGRRSQPDHRCR